MRYQVSVVRRLNRRGQNPRGGGGESISERINSSLEKRIKLRNSMQFTYVYRN
jgi:hypothetical protein